MSGHALVVVSLVEEPDAVAAKVLRHLAEAHIIEALPTASTSETSRPARRRGETRADSWRRR